LSPSQGGMFLLIFSKNKKTAYKCRLKYRNLFGRIAELICRIYNIYLILLNCFLFKLTKSNIFFSTHGEMSFHPWFGTGNIVFQLENITWDHFCLTISNHNFWSLFCISRNLYGIFKSFVGQKFFYFLLKWYFLRVIVKHHIYNIF